MDQEGLKKGQEGLKLAVWGKKKGLSIRQGTFYKVLT